MSDVDALVAGLSAGGMARCLLVPAGELPAELWMLLLERRPLCIVSRIDGADVLDTAVFTADTIGEAGEPAAAMFGSGVSDATVSDDTVVTVLWPVPKLVVVGGGPVASALDVAASLLGWQTDVTNDAAVATGLIAALAPLDKVVVAAHDLELAGSALAAALETDVGYIGALGGHRMQQARADWLAYRGITELERIHGPAGLDIGAETPAQIAVAILAEALAAEAGKPRRVHWISMTRQSDEALEVLRSVWAAQEESAADLDEDCSPTKNCKNMKDITFDGYAEPGSDLIGAWRENSLARGS